MTSKQIYESIDQSKIKETGKKFLKDAERQTKGFTIKNEKLDAVMLKIYKDLKEKKPEALKDVKVSKTPKTKKKTVVKKKNTKPTKTPSTPKKKTVPFTKRASELAKKEGITFKQAKSKLSKTIKEDSEKEEKKVEKEIDKLLKFVRKDSFEDGEKYPKTHGKQDPKKASLSSDAKRQALPRGKRISKNGKVYYENRDNRSDRNSVPTKKGKYKYKGDAPPYLEKGGEIDAFIMKTIKDVPDSNLQVDAEKFNAKLKKGGLLNKDTKYIRTEQVISIKLKNGKEYENSYGSLRFLSGAYISDKVVTENEIDKNQLSLFKKGGKLPKNALYIKRADIESIKFENDDYVDETVEGKYLLNGFWIDPIKDTKLIKEAKEQGRLEKGGRTSYADISETDLFELGGGLPNGAFQSFEQTYLPATNTPVGYAKGGEIDLFEDYESQPKNLSVIVEKYEERYVDGDMDYEDTAKFLKEVEAIGYTFDSGLDNEPYGLRPIMAKGGNLDSHGLKKGDEIIETIEGNIQKVKGTDGKIVYVRLSDGYRGADVPLPFEKGGQTKKRPKSALMRDRKYFNKNESWERQYSKGKNRKGYKKAKGGSVGGTKRQTPMSLAKEIRKEGEKWQDAVKRASAIIGKK